MFWWRMHKMEMKTYANQRLRSERTKKKIATIKYKIVARLCSKNVDKEKTLLELRDSSDFRLNNFSQRCDLNIQLIVHMQLIFIAYHLVFRKKATKNMARLSIPRIIWIVRIVAEMFFIYAFRDHIILFTLYSDRHSVRKIFLFIDRICHIFWWFLQDSAWQSYFMQLFTLTLFLSILLCVESDINFAGSLHHWPWSSSRGRVQKFLHAQFIFDEYRENSQYGATPKYAPKTVAWNRSTGLKPQIAAFAKITYQTNSSTLSNNGSRTVKYHQPYEFYRFHLYPLRSC